jgi:hypothetical protein
MSDSKNMWKLFDNIEFCFEKNLNDQFLVITSDDAIETVISRILKKRKMNITGYHYNTRNSERRVLISLWPGHKASLDKRRTTTFN